MKKVLTIAGSDPSGGAGIQADLATFSAFHVQGFSAITAVTAQAPSSVRGVFPVPPSFVVEQIEAVTGAFAIDAIKIGMAAKGETLTAIAELLDRLTISTVVLDPVISSSGGFPLLEGDGVPALRALLPRVHLVTPNLHEASQLTGREVATEEDMGVAAERISAMGPAYVLVKGGHLRGKAVDILYDGEEITRHVAEKVGREMHGTGCVLSAAIAASLAKGETMTGAVEKAKEYVTGLIRSGGH